ncbi:MAG: SGNH/GDSL hydrolase family protein [Weeksellaceae bacterium]|nr:SGNH/GDSL hydrolase family protein [Weeksellaceae bacterium]
MKLFYKSIFLAALVFAVGCNDEFDNDVNNVTVQSGDANFSKYVALGNSLTAGYADNALYSSGQINSYPNILATQMARAGGGAFVQPLMPNDVGGFTDLGVPGRLRLQVINGALTPVASNAEGTFQASFMQGPVNNMGVPGAKSFHLAAQGYGNPQGISQGLANPYFARFASSPTTSVIADAVAQQPTFFTLWIGNNDVLSYATSGGVGVNQAGNLNPATYGSNDISAPQVVAGAIQQMLEALVMQGGAKGAIANIPSVTSIPYFNTVPSKPLTSSNAAYASQIGMLNEFYSNLNMVFQALGVAERQIHFSAEEASGVVLVDETLPNISQQLAGALTQAGLPAQQAQLLGSIFGQVRQSNENDLIVLPASSIIGQVDTDRVQQLMGMGLSQEQAGQLSVNGLTYPLADRWVLIPSEQQLVAEATTAYNQAIAGLAAQYQLALVDMHSRMNELQSGIVFSGVDYNASFVTGGAFSLDGVHLTPRGNAVVANYFIQAINQRFGSTLPQVDPNSFGGVQIP